MIKRDPEGPGPIVYLQPLAPIDERPWWERFPWNVLVQVLAQVVILAVLGAFILFAMLVGWL